MVRRATLVLLTLAACSDLREFRGTWSGPLVGDSFLQLNAPAGPATLAIDEITSHSLRARLTIDGLVPATAITSLKEAEADALADLTFAGSPLKVFLSFVPVPDGGGDVLVLIALFDDRRVQLRLLRGGSKPLYGIFALAESTS